MIKLTISAEIQNQLFYNVLNETHKKTRLKNLVLYLKSFDYEHKEICKVCQITKPTLIDYLNDFKENGINSFKTIRWKGQKSELNKYIELIDKDFENEPPKTINEAQYRIEILTGIKRSPTQIQYFLKKLNYKLLKVGQIPGNGDGLDDIREEQREEFKKKNWNLAWQKQ